MEFRVVVQPPSPPAAAGISLRAPRVQGSGFTLVEVLVVITIIAILAGLISAAAMVALNTAKDTRIKTEVDQLDAAMKAFKSKYDSYPPCDLRYDPNQTAASNPTVFYATQNLQAFVRHAFPRYRIQTLSPPDNLLRDLMTCGIDTTSFRPDQALVFWLRGFSPDVTQPFTGSGVREPFFGFDKTRLRWTYSPILFQDSNNNGIYDSGEPGSAPPAGAVYAQVYVPLGGKEVPYCYFDARVYPQNDTTGLKTYPPGSSAPVANPLTNLAYGDTALASSRSIFFAAYSRPPLTSNGTIPPGAFAGCVVPYALDANGNGTYDTGDCWANSDSFQIISAGQDGMFGETPLGTPPGTSSTQSVRFYPTGLHYVPLDDNDNITNFCPKTTLGDAKP